MINSKFTLFLFSTFISILSTTTANEDIFDDYKTFVDQLIGSERRKRENNKSTGDSSSEEENDKNNKEILNQTKVIQIKEGPSIYVYPNKEILLDYHNGTIIKMNKNESNLEENNLKNRKRRFSSINGLYMAHGLSFNEKDSEHFGEDDFNEKEIGTNQNMEGNLELKLDNNFEEILNEDNKDGNEFKTRFGGNPYLVKPLYDREGKMEEQNKKIFDLPDKSSRKDKINYLMIPNKEIQPPSPSPNFWLQQRLNSEEPLNEEEEELMSILLNKFGRNNKNNLNYLKNEEEEGKEELILTTTKTLKTNVKII
ncbi:unnamed protein product [Meloidogyne enterolobii]|uniref:Uncharacterized protein n=1 Tax=Meloidogyne enterolobii TaxID=390850 RepID=A0ACB0XVI6_MELEN